MDREDDDDEFLRPRSPVIMVMTTTGTMLVKMTINSYSHMTTKMMMVVMTIHP